MHPAFRIEQFQGVNVPIRTDNHFNDVVSLWVNRRANEVMFSASHASETKLPRENAEHWVPATFCLPTKVVPREGVEDGIIVSLETMMDVFYPGFKPVC